MRVSFSSCIVMAALTLVTSTTHAQQVRSSEEGSDAAAADELLPPDEELAPDELELNDSEEPSPQEAPGPSPEKPSVSPPQPKPPSADVDPEFDALEAEALGLTEPPPGATASPSPSSSPSPASASESASESRDGIEEASAQDGDVLTSADATVRHADEISRAQTLGLVGCGLAAVLAGAISIIANPLMALWVVFNVFAPAIALPVCGGGLLINQTLAAAAGWAFCIAAPLPGVAAVAGGAAGAGAQMTMTRPWLPLGASALAALPGVAVGAASGVVVLGGLAYGLSLEHLDIEGLRGGGIQAIYLTLPRATTGLVIALIGGIMGSIAAPVAGGAAVAVGYGVAQLEGEETKERTMTPESSQGAVEGVPTTRQVAW